ncbi:uncharacterized protein LOC133519549 [Cydia pomonella]|uniref:uncharacterized protein LOC133519549 n=1 Tax=Cydia pomonella TaxID=82600 RepID=UPI002ADE5769|nr:uncharacterized protein LOC133519549 [Cydia pomonella]
MNMGSSLCVSGDKNVNNEVVVLQSMIVLYWVWIVFTLVYVAMMVVALLVMLIGFNTLRMRGVALMPLVALLYYILTLYFICVVNTHRQETQRAGWVLAGPGAGREGSGASNASTEALRDPTATTAVTMPTTSVPRRGRCVIPSVNPAHGAYYGVLPNKKFALPDHSYPRLRLWVACDQYHRARHLRYALCYSGGWNLPLPDCVRG